MKSIQAEEIILLITVKVMPRKKLNVLEMEEQAT